MNYTGISDDAIYLHGSIFYLEVFKSCGDDVTMMTKRTYCAFSECLQTGMLFFD